MKVAITCRENNADALIDQRFGRCAYFAIYNTEDHSLEFVENTAHNAAEGAGPAAVAIIANREVGKVVSGEFGFKIKNMLNDLNIQMVIFKEEKSVKEITALLNH